MDYHTTQVPSSGSGRNRRQFATRRDELTAVPRPDLNTILSRRDYRLDALYTIALWERPGAPRPLAELAARLHEPVFTLYLGRKSCPLALPLAAQVVTEDNIQHAMDNAQLPLPEDFTLQPAQHNAGPDSTGMRMATRGCVCSTRSLVAMRCILGAAGSLCPALSTTLRCPHRSQTMSEYLFSRLTPRADLGFSQIEKFARLDPYGQHQAVWQLFDVPPVRREHAPRFFSGTSGKAISRRFTCFPTALHRTVPACGASNRNPMRPNSPRATGSISSYG